MDGHDTSADEPDLARLGAAIRAQRQALGLTRPSLLGAWYGPRSASQHSSAGRMAGPPSRTPHCWPMPSSSPLEISSEHPATA